MLIDFWTYTCINCIRTLPYLKSWDERVPRRRADDRRRARARVRVREGRRQRRRRDRRLRDLVPGGPGQRARDLDRVREPVLAGEVPDRRRGRGPLRALRRGRLRARPRRRSARCSPRPATARSAARRGRRARWRRPTRACAPPRPTSASPARRGSSTAPSRARRTTQASTRPRSASTSSPTAAPGTSVRSRRPRSATRRSRSASRRGGCSSSSASEDGARELEVLLDGEPISAADAGEDVSGSTVDGHRPAPLPARRPAPGRPAHARAALRRRDRGLRVHVRLSHRPGGSLDTGG